MHPMIYVYCILRKARKPTAARVQAGLPDADRPEVVALDEALWLVTSRVPPDRYGPGALEPALRDLDWVGRIALAHEAVVEHFSRLRGATVIPMKLFTMFSTVERARLEMRRRRQALVRAFDHIQGCHEWGVRILRSNDRSGVPRAASPTSGTAFLAMRKNARDRAASRTRSAVEAADETFEALSLLARDRRRRHETGGGPAPLLDAAFLVPARRRARFQAAATRLAKQVAQRGGAMTLTGPWPAYNFVGAGES